MMSSIRYSVRLWYFFTGIIYLLNDWKTFLLSQVLSTSYHQEKEEIGEEHTLIEKCRKDPHYFAGIYEKYYEDIFRFVYKRIGDEYVTADLTSKVFFNSLKSLHRYSFQGVPFASWLYKIAVNEVNQYYRAQKTRDRMVSLEDHHVEQLMDEIEVNEPTPDPTIMVAALLEMLKPEEIQFLELRFFEGCSFKEVGYLTGLTEINAKVKTYRILKKLKDLAEKKKNIDQQSPL